MFHALGENADDMLISQGIVNHFALFAELDQLVGLQHPKLVGHGALGDLHQLGNVAHAQLPIAQFTDDARPCGIAADLEKLRYFRDRPGLVFVHGLHLPYIFQD